MALKYNPMNPNETWVNHPGFIAMYLVLFVICHLVLLSLPISTELVWTLTNVCHCVVSLHVFLSHSHTHTRTHTILCLGVFDPVWAHLGFLVAVLLLLLLTPIGFPSHFLFFFLLLAPPCSSCPRLLLCRCIGSKAPPLKPWMRASLWG